MDPLDRTQPRSQLEGPAATIHTAQGIALAGVAWHIGQDTALAPAALYTAQDIGLARYTVAVVGKASVAGTAWVAAYHWRVVGSVALDAALAHKQAADTAGR